MRDGMVVFDAVVHMLDLRERHGVHDDAPLLLRQASGFTKVTARKGPPAADLEAGPPAVDVANRMLFEEAQTDLAMAQTVPIFGLFEEGPGPARLNYELAASNPERVYFCGGVDPLYQGVRGAIDEMRRQVEEWGAVSFKFYQAQTASMAWRADDRRLAYPLFEAAQELGIRLVQFHKGQPQGRQRVEDLAPNDIQLAAYDFPDLTFGLHHFGEPYVDETINIAARFENVYLVLPTLFNQYFVQPRLMLDRLGKALFYCGDDRLCYGTDAFMWPHVQAYIDAFAEMQIPEDMQDGYGYPALTREGRERILGLNIARALGVDLDAKRRELGLPAG